MKTETPADRAVRLINGLSHTSGPFAGELFELRKWQEHQIIRPLFTTRKDGLRQYRTCLLMLPRKNGKSEICAALAIYFLLFDGEIGAQVYSAAADREQAALVFNVAAQMIRNDPELLEVCEIIDSQKRIVHRKSGSFYRAISAEAYSKHGFNASVVIYDELHAAPSRVLWDVMSTSQGARLQPLMLAITTAGYDRHSILWELYAHAKKVEENPSIDPAFLPIIFEAPIDADWTSEKVWKAANPALGDFRSLEEMRTACQRAQSIPAQENTFRRLYLNQWTEQSERWIDLATWDASAGVVDVAELRGRKCFAGLDLSSRTDLTALVLVFPDEDGGTTVLPYFFVPGDNVAARERTDRVPYAQWIKAGHITATPGNVVDQGFIRERINQLGVEFSIQELAFDPWNATKITTELKGDGFEVVELRQGFRSLSEPTKHLGALVASKKLRHGGHPVLRWMASNMVVRQDPNGNLAPDKSKATDKIDGIVALITGLARSIVQPQRRSVYERRGVLVL
ncbi:MAG TPA: terminase [Mycobacterium sp.]|nr:terminase [Mycobacterium sp.]